MKLEIQLRGIEHHVAIVEQEKRDLLKLLDEMEEYQIHAEQEQLRLDDTISLLNRLKESINNRTEFLNTLVTDYLKLQQEISVILQETADYGKGGNENG